jgi:hypothetical protein
VSLACSLAVVPAQAGTHIPEPVVMGPRLRGDDHHQPYSVFPNDKEPA